VPSLSAAFDGQAAAAAVEATSGGGWDLDRSLQSCPRASGSGVVDPIFHRLEIEEEKKEMRYR
jgi:hypothetical protein